MRRPGTSDYKDFTFDAVYAEEAVQADFYEHTGYAIVGELRGRCRLRMFEA